MVLRNAVLCAQCCLVLLAIYSSSLASIWSCQHWVVIDDGFHNRIIAAGSIHCTSPLEMDLPFCSRVVLHLLDPDSGRPPWHLGHLIHGDNHGVNANKNHIFISQGKSHLQQQKLPNLNFCFRAFYIYQFNPRRKWTISKYVH